jgi:type I restriction enzyme, S subunit
MIAEFRGYAAMKDSGVPWLGDVPEHWEVRRTKTVLRERVQKGFPDEPLLAATQTKGVVRKALYENRTVLALKDLHLLKLARVGDFVISLRSFQGGIEYAREQGIISPAYTVLYPTAYGIHGYLAWLFKSNYYVQSLSLYVTGIRQGQTIDYTRLSQSELPLPPSADRFAIVQFLDHADRRIRRYISRKMKLVRLLEEQKHAIIYRAVTRGLDPNARLKPSGVAWLGDVPEHWEVRRLKNVFYRIVGGSTPASTEATYWNGDLIWITPSDVSRTDRLTTSLRRITQEGLRSCSSELVAPGSIIVTSRAPVGNVSLAEVALCTNQGCKALLVSNDVIDPMFAVAVLRVLKEELQSLATGTTFSEISTSRLGVVRMPLPPVSEQCAIVQSLEMATSNIVSAIERTQREISLLHEYRTRLIADVVTGKLDVRGAAARLPEEVEEPDQLGEVEAMTDAGEASDDEIDVVPEDAEV